MTATMTDLTRFSALVDKVYEGALDPTVWPDVLARAADWMASSKAIIHTPLNAHDGRGYHFLHGFEEEAVALYQKHIALDVWTQAGVERQVFIEGKIMCGTDLVPEETLYQTPFYRDCLAVYDFPKMITGIVFDGQTQDTVATTCCFYRGQRHAPFGVIEVERYRLLLPHLSRALGVMCRLREADLRQAASLSALDCLSAGVLLVAPSGEVVFANRSAQRIVETWDGLRLEEQPGRSSTRLVADDTDTQAKLDEAIRRSVDGEVIDIPHFGLSLRIPRPSGLPAYALQFSALPEQNEFGQGIAMPRAIVFLTDSAEAVTIAPQLLSNLFGLTPAEARLAAELVQGDELADSAARLNISLNTAKSQLHSIYAKIGVDTRAKLSKMLLALAAQRTS